MVAIDSCVTDVYVTCSRASIAEEGLIRAVFKGDSDGRLKSSVQGYKGASACMYNLDLTTQKLVNKNRTKLQQEAARAKPTSVCRKTDLTMLRYGDVGDWRSREVISRRL